MDDKFKTKGDFIGVTSAALTTRQSSQPSRPGTTRIFAFIGLDSSGKISRGNCLPKRVVMILVAWRYITTERPAVGK